MSDIENFKKKISEFRTVENELNDFRKGLKTKLEDVILKNNIKLNGESFKASSSSGLNYILVDLTQKVTLKELGILEMAMQPKEVLIESFASTKSILNDNYGKPFLRIRFYY
jgi:hypothetical protein